MQTESELIVVADSLGKYTCKYSRFFFIDFYFLFSNLKIFQRSVVMNSHNILALFLQKCSSPRSSLCEGFHRIYCDFFSLWSLEHNIRSIWATLHWITIAVSCKTKQVQLSIFLLHLSIFFLKDKWGVFMKINDRFVHGVSNMHYSVVRLSQSCIWKNHTTSLLSLLMFIPVSK